MWKPLLEALDKESSEFIGSVVLYFLENHSHIPGNQTEDISQCYAAGWVQLLLQSKSKSSLMLASDLPWVNLLKISLDNPTLCSLTFVQLIVENIPLIDASLKEKIQRLVTIFAGQFSPDCDSSNDLEKSQDVDLEGWIASKSKTCLDESLQPNKPREWEASQESTQWYLIPCGDILGTSDVSPNNLELLSPSMNPITQLQHTA